VQLFALFCNFWLLWFCPFLLSTKMPFIFILCFLQIFAFTLASLIPPFCSVYANNTVNSLGKEITKFWITDTW
jgi:hypothetical protein